MILSILFLATKMVVTNSCAVPPPANPEAANKALIRSREFSTCSSYPEDCEAVYRCGVRCSGEYMVYPRTCGVQTAVTVYCDMETDSGGWTVIQRRGDFGKPKAYFHNNWDVYKEGFGAISEDFWIGNDLLFILTNQNLQTLRFDLKDLDGKSKWAKYDKFVVDSEVNNYTLHVQGYTGDAGDSFTVHNGMQFTTKDRDNDKTIIENCAVTYKGAWWYNACHESNLNGLYLYGTQASFADGVNWSKWRGYYYSLPITEMKIRPFFT